MMIIERQQDLAPAVLGDLVQRCVGNARAAPE
jgi:hypothetical protein